MEMKPPRRTLPIAALSDRGIVPSRNIPRVGLGGRAELLAIWDRLSNEGRQFVLTMARAKDQEERRSRLEGAS